MIFVHIWPSCVGGAVVYVNSRTSQSPMQIESRDNILQWAGDNHAKSIACVAMLTLLAAESLLGLGAWLMTGPLLAGNHLRSAIGLRRNQHIGALIPVGYPADKTRE